MLQAQAMVPESTKSGCASASLLHGFLQQACTHMAEHCALDGRG